MPGGSSVLGRLPTVGAMTDTTEQIGRPQSPEGVDSGHDVTVTAPLTALCRDEHQALLACGILHKTHPDVVSALIKQLRTVCFPSGHVILPRANPAIVCT
jgi:hypothetical protein